MMNTDQTSIRILIIEDNVISAQSLRRSLHAQAFNAKIRFEIEMESMVPLEVDPAEWAAKLADGFDVVILDQRLGPVEGLTLIEPIKAANPNTAVIVLTGHESPADGVRALRAGAWRYLPKPEQPAEMLIAIQTWLEWRRTWSERAWLRVLHDFSATVQGLDDPQAVAEAIVAAAARLGFANTRLWRLENGREQEEKRLRGWAQRGLDITTKAFNEVTIPVAESVYSKLTLSGKSPQVFQGRERGPGYADDLLYPEGNRPAAGLWVDLPLWAGERCLGKLSLDGHPEIQAYNEDERSLLTLLSQQAAAALARVEAEAERRQRARETEQAADNLRLLHRMGRELPILMALDEQKGWLATLTALTAQYGLRCNRALLFRVEPGDHGHVAQGLAGVGELTPEAARQAWEEDVARSWKLDDYLVALKRDEIEPTRAHRLMQKLAFPISTERDDPFSRLVREGKAMRLRGEDWLRLPKRYRKFFQADETALVPAFLDENVVGILAVDHFADQKPITAVTLQHLQLFVNQSLLIQQEVRQRRRLRQLLGAGQMLSQAAANQPLGQTLERLCEIACQITGADLATIYPFQPETRKYDVVNVGAYGHRAYRAPSERTRKHGASAYVLEQGWLEVVNTDIAEALPDSKPWKERSFFKREGAKAILATRLQIGTDIVGLLYLNWRQPHAFETNEREAVRLLASLAANAVRNAQGIAYMIENLDEQQLRIVTQATELTYIQQIEKVALQTGSDRNDLIRLILQTASETLHLPRPSYINLDLRQTGPNDEVEHYTLDEQENLHRERRSPSALIAQVIRNHRVYRFADVWRGRWQAYFRQRPEIRSVLSVPLRAGNRCLGAIKVESPEVNHFQTEHEEKLKRVASTATLALEHLEQQEELNRLLEVAKALTIPTDLGDTLEKIRQQLIQTAPGLDAFAIWYKDPDTNQLWLGTSEGLKTPESVTQPLPVKGFDSPVTRMLSRKEPIWPKNAARSRILRGEFIEREGIRSCGAIPLRVENKAVGVMFLNYRTTHVFREREKRLFRLFGELVAIALQDETLRAASEKRLQRLQLAQEIQTEMSRARVEDELLKPVIETLHKHFPTSVASILRYEPERQRLRVPRTVQDHYQADSGSRSDHVFIPIERKSIVTHVLKQALDSGRSAHYYSPDVHQDPYYLPLRSQTNSELCVSMQAENQVMGVISLESNQPDRFSDEDQMLLETLASAAGMALSRMHHAQEATRSTSLALMSAEGGELFHDIGNIVSPLRGEVHLLKSERNLSDDAKRSLAVIDRQADRLHDLSRLPPLPDPLDPQTDLTREHFARLHQVIRNKTDAILKQFAAQQTHEWHVHYQLEESDPRVSIHPLWLERVLRHLLVNALQAMSEGGKLTIKTETTNERAYIRITDTGPGVPSEMIPRLFRERIPPQNARGKGRGLLQTALVVEAYGGTVELERRPLKDGCSILLSLPLAHFTS